MIVFDIVTSPTFLNVVLNGWKQDTFNGCNACDVYDGSVIMFNFNSFAYSIASKIMWLPCPSRINKCSLVRNTPPRIDFLKKNKNS